MTTTSIYRPLRTEVTNAIGESQTENPWISAGIALEVCRAELEARFSGVRVLGVDGLECSGTDFIRNLLRP